MSLPVVIMDSAGSSLGMLFRFGPCNYIGRIWQCSQSRLRRLRICAPVDMVNGGDLSLIIAVMAIGYM